MELPASTKEELDEDLPPHPNKRPHYTKDIQHIVTNEETARMLGRAKNARDRFIITTLYLTGCRPIELTKLTRDAISEMPDGSLSITLHTAKLGQRKGFFIGTRTLQLAKGSAFLEYIRGYALAFPPGSTPLCPITEVRVRQIIYETSLDEFCPYHFRHSRMTKLARLGWSIDMLMYWKGSSKAGSVSAYLAGKPVLTVVSLE